MKKETSIAVFLGILLGVIFGVFLIFKNKQSQLDKTKAITPKNKITPTIVLNNNNLNEFFKLEKPSDGIITDNDEIVIQGKASKGTTIIIQSPSSQLVNKTENESFKIEFPLALGENVISITAYPKDIQSRPVEKQVKIYYLKTQL